MRVAVVGAGIHGLSTTYALAHRGHDVTCFEALTQGHTRGSSHGASRIVRKAYPDVFYTSIMAEAYPLWAELEQACGQRLLHEVGLVYFGNSDSESIRGVAKGLEEVGVIHECLDYRDVSSRHPQLRLKAGEIGVFTPEAGWVDAAAAVAHTSALASQLGAQILYETAVEAGAPGIERLESEYDAYVVAPGAWIKRWVPNLNVRVTAQTVAYFEARVEGPVWIEDSAVEAYGFPTDPELGLKLALHQSGLETDPEASSRSEDESAIEFLDELLSRRFGIQNSPRGISYTCLYTRTPDEDFRWGRLGERGYFVSACSGHGFKFGPWIGKKMADFVESIDQPESTSRFFVSQ